MTYREKDGSTNLKSTKNSFNMRRRLVFEKDMTSIVIPNGHENPKAGDTTINARVFSFPELTKAEVPSSINAEPIKPQIKA